MSSRADHPTFHARLGVTPHPRFREETPPPPGPEVIDLDAEPATLPTQGLSFTICKANKSIYSPHCSED